MLLLALLFQTQAFQKPLLLILELKIALIITGLNEEACSLLIALENIETLVQQSQLHK